MNLPMNKMMKKQKVGMIRWKKKAHLAIGVMHR